jgi:hypothetical protein
MEASILDLASILDFDPDVLVRLWPAERVLVCAFQCKTQPRPGRPCPVPDCSGQPRPAREDSAPHCGPNFIISRPSVEKGGKIEAFVRGCSVEIPSVTGSRFENIKGETSKRRAKSFSARRTFVIASRGRGRGHRRASLSCVVGRTSPHTNQMVLCFFQARENEPF